MISTIENSKKLPTKWKAPKKPTFRENILQDAEIKTAIINHHKQPYLDRISTEKY
jgi:hypothetical protein